MAYYCEKQSQMGFTSELKGILTLDTETKSPFSIDNRSTMKLCCH